MESKSVQPVKKQSLHHHSTLLDNDPSIPNENFSCIPDSVSIFGESDKISKRKYNKKDRSQTVGEISLEERICPECNNDDLIEDEVTGDLICTSCGMVLDSHLFFSDKTAMTFNNMDESEVLQNKSKGFGKNSTPEHISRKIQQAERWTHSWADIHQIIVKKEINRYIYELDLPKYVSDSANNLYQKVYRKSAIQGRGIKAMTAACMYVICRQHQIPVFFQDIENVSKQEHSTIRKCFNYIMDNFKIKLPVLNAKQFIPQLVEKLNLSEIVEKVSIKVLIRLEQSNWGNQINNPKHLASISIFFAYNILHKARKLNISISQKEFSNRIGMSETTLRKYKKLFQNAVTVNF